jgi:hypothetical protein
MDVQNSQSGRAAADQLSPRERKIRLAVLLTAILLIAFSWVAFGILAGMPPGAVPWC